MLVQRIHQVQLDVEDSPFQKANLNRGGNALSPSSTNGSSLQLLSPEGDKQQTIKRVSSTSSGLSREDEDTDEQFQRVSRPRPSQMMKRVSRNNVILAQQRSQEVVQEILEQPKGTLRRNRSNEQDNMRLPSLLETPCEKQLRLLNKAIWNEQTLSLRLERKTKEAMATNHRLRMSINYLLRQQI